MRLGIDSFVSRVTDPSSGEVYSPVQRVAHLLEEIEFADEVGLDHFGIGEHHRSEYYEDRKSVV